MIILLCMEWCTGHWLKIKRSDGKSKHQFVVMLNPWQMADDSELANPFVVAVFTVISNLSFICSFFGLFNTETDDQ